RRAIVVRIVVERHVAAPPEVVWDLVSTPSGWLSWQGTEADITAEIGGPHGVNIRGDAFAGGSIVEIVPHKRITFTWGFEIEASPLPAGSTLVSIELIPRGNGTLVRLTQEGVPDGFESVQQGWEHYLDRLAVVAAGPDPGPDPNVGRPSA
ncbi:MAG: SRPBCC domain-containing protein, partial [Ilumatobacteraceae bacterium]